MYNVLAGSSRQRYAQCFDQYRAALVWNLLIRELLDEGYSDMLGNTISLQGTIGFNKARLFGDVSTERDRCRLPVPNLSLKCRSPPHEAEMRRNEDPRKYLDGRG